MRKLIYLMAALLFMSPVVAKAEWSGDDLPATSTWYFHMDFKEMRSSDAGRGIYEWLNEEAFEEILEETGIDFSKEINEVTAYAMRDAGPVIMLQGPISRDTKDKVMAIAAASGDVRPYKASGKPYYFFSDNGKHDDDEDEDSGNINIHFDDDEAFFSLALKDKIVITSSKEQMEHLLGNGGRIEGTRNHKDALFVLSAERNLLQAGADAENFSGDDDWDSNILQHTKQLALLVADVKGKIAISAELLATEAEMADSLASIARGLISLASFSSDMEPEVAEMLRNTRVDVKDSTLKVSLAMDPDAFVAILKD
jgi:hypothetical protein